ncbi:MAG: hypothetical protein GXO72_01330, partial [Caldiserica bacterium]|nr:hypothetical protein [Caldisericota bacterium]
MRAKSLCISFLGALLLLSTVASATELVFFRRHGCSHCARIEAFVEGELLPRYPGLEVRYFEVDDPEAQEVLAKLLRAYGIGLELEELYTPLIFVGDYALIATGGIAGGLRVYGMEAEPFVAAGPAEEIVLEDAVRMAIEADAPSPLTRIAGVEGEGLAEVLTIPALVLAAAADSVNPCTFAVLILLLGTLLVAGKRGKVLWVGLSFIAAIYISYFLMGLGIFTAIQTAGVQRPFILTVSALAILLGLWNMKDYFAYGKWFTIEVPQRWRPLVKKLTSSAVTIPGAFAVGVLDSFFLLPCSSGPYIANLEDEHPAPGDRVPPLLQPHLHPAPPGHRPGDPLRLHHHRAGGAVALGPAGQAALRGGPGDVPPGGGYDHRPPARIPLSRRSPGANGK